MDINMKIRCAKCGFENGSSASFCNHCGEKLKMDEEPSPDPAVQEKKQTKKAEKEKKAVPDGVRNVGKKSRKSIVWMVVILSLLLLVLVILGAALIPWGLPVYTAPDETTAEYRKKEESAFFKLQVCTSKDPSRFFKSVKFSMDELNILINKHFLKPGKIRTDSWSLEHIVLSEENGRIRALVFSTLFDTFPLVLRAEGMASAGGSSGELVTVRVDSAGVGHLPVPFCRSIVSSQIMKILSRSKDIRRAFERAETVMLNKDDLVFQFALPGKNGRTSD